MKKRYIALAVLAACGDQPVEPSLSVTATTTTILAAGDIAGCTSSFKDEQTAAIVAQYPDARVWVLGDNVYHNSDSTAWANCYNKASHPTTGKYWGLFKSRTDPTIGNHEYNDPAGDAKGYAQYFGSVAGPEGRFYYVRQFGAWRVYTLNSELSSGGRADQLAWLRADLAANPRLCIVAKWHKPTFSSSAVHPSDGNNMLPVWAELDKANAELVLQGHNHHFEYTEGVRTDSTPDILAPRSFVVGTGGAGLYDFRSTPLPISQKRIKAHGVLKLVLSDTRYDFQFIGLGGTVLATGGRPCR